MDPRSLNRYAYAHGNPVNYKDPSGHDVVVKADLDQAQSKSKIIRCEITDKVQAAVDQLMQISIRILLEKEKYSRDRWETLNYNDRWETLQSFIREVAGIMNVGINEITSVKSNSYYGKYNHKRKEMRINVALLHDDNEYDVDAYSLFETVIHEVRHAYQHNAVEHPEKYAVTNENINLWKTNFDNYINEESEGYTYEKYRYQPVEADAFAFSEGVMSIEPYELYDSWRMFNRTRK